MQRDNVREAEQVIESGRGFQRLVAGARPDDRPFPRESEQPAAVALVYPSRAQPDPAASQDADGAAMQVKAAEALEGEVLLARAGRGLSHAAIEALH